MMRRLSLLPALVIVGTAFVPQPEPALAQQAGPTLDYEFFRSQVQPIFLADRPGHPRCISCHAGQYLQPLSSEATTWNEEQSHQNFESVSRLVTPGTGSQLNIMPDGLLEGLTRTQVRELFSYLSSPKQVPLRD